MMFTEIHTHIKMKIITVLQHTYDNERLNLSRNIHIHFYFNITFIIYNYDIIYT